MKTGNILFILIVVILTACTSKTENIELVLDTKSDLGEGAIWNNQTQKLYWVNITGKILNIYDPSSGENRELRTGQMIGTVVPTESGNVLVALEKGIYQMDISTGTKKQIIDPEETITGNRFNDGKCDPSGRFWAGTMSLSGEQKAGSLYRFDGDSTIHKMVENVSISNGIVWTSDLKRMYYIDTPTQVVMGYDYNNVSGEITNGKVAVNIPSDMGSPDGMTIDDEGNLWICLWGGSAVGCWNPQTGELIRKIEVPAKNVTSCAFGGEDLGTLYITTARQDTNDKELERFPNAGGVFKTHPGVKGVPADFFKGEL